MEIAPHATIEDAYCNIVNDCMAQILANRQHLIEPDNSLSRGECLHKMRVGVRRLRSARSLFKPAMDTDSMKKDEAFYNDFADDLKWLQLTLGRARDWDVFIHGTVERLYTTCRHVENRRDLTVLLNAAERQQGAAYKTVMSVINGTGNLQADRFADFIEEAETTMLCHPFKLSSRNQPIGKYADFILRKQTRKVVKLGKKLSLDDASREAAAMKELVSGGAASIRAQELHELRKQCKKLRYGVDFFASLYPTKRAKRFHDVLADLQDTIGGVVDVDAGEFLMHSFPVHKKKQKTSVARARTLVSGWMLGQSARNITEIDDAWTKLTALVDSKPLWEH